MCRRALPLTFNIISFSFGSFLFALLLSTPVIGIAQTPRAPSSVVTGADNSNSDDQHAAGELEDEMRAKRAIKFAEEEHKENIERAKELSAIGVKLLASVKQKKSLDKDDGKQLDRLEKLTKLLRSKAGGSGTEVTIDKPPADLIAAVSRVAEQSDSLSCLVQKTPRQVVSATVIDETNVLLQLIEMVRHFSSP